MGIRNGRSKNKGNLHKREQKITFRRLEKIERSADETVISIGQSERLFTGF